MVYKKECDAIVRTLFEVCLDLGGGL